MNHRGEILKKALAATGVKLVSLAKSMDVDRKTIYNWFTTPNIPIEKMIEIGKILRYDFTTDIPEMRKFIPNTGTNDVELDYRTKYIMLLEDHNALLKSKNDELIKKIATNDGLISLLNQIAGQLGQKKSGVDIILS